MQPTPEPTSTAAAEGPPPVPELAPSAPGPARFRLLRYFTLATLAAFVAVGAALFMLQRQEVQFYAQTQSEQQRLFAAAQADLAAQHEAAARASLMAVHEAGHVTLTGVVANTLWKSHFAPFVERASRLPAEPCRALPRSPGASAPDAGRRACFAELGRRIRALPGFEALDAKAYDAMHGTRVFKIKVWDLRGIAVYSSEQRQIGEDGAGNRGWRHAMAGQPASELTHRDRFSAFEGVVENRDLISTYVPVRDAAGAVVGVFELYSDVTPFLEQIREASRRFAAVAGANEARVQEAGRRNEEAVARNSQHLLLVIGALLSLLFAISLVIVRIGQGIIDRQSEAQAQATRREQLWHREKMAALSAMAANVAHEVGNPLAVIAGVAQELPAASGAAGTPPPAQRILEQTARIARMMRRMADFADARSGQAECVDVNAMVKAVCDFQSFDRRFRGIPIEFRGAEGLPACELVPDELNEALMTLLQACAAASGERTPLPRIEVTTEARGDGVAVRIGCGGGAAADADGAPAGPTAEAPPWPSRDLLQALRRRLPTLAGRLVAGPGAASIVLPGCTPPGAPEP